ncbi:HEPN domain-containing protein [Actinomadura formosensis]|uniref:HEPN domain-containing protein n=1 Tax=Actinomadura formosensis TaxID=60706 RepID=UPI003D8D832F
MCAAKRGAPPKLSARDAFNLNIEDAETLVALAKLLQNRRTRKMRRELRQRAGEALRLPQKQWNDLECLESDAVFAIFKPGHASWRERLTEPALRPLLRQALVAACAAVETFCADRVMERYSATMKLEERPRRLLDLPLTVETHLDIQSHGKPGQGLRNAVETQVRQLASPAPAQIGELFALVGEKRLLTRVDGRRGVAKETTTADLQRIVERRNRIAHTGDRAGRGRAAITVAEVEADLSILVSIIDALDAETRPHA